MINPGQIRAARAFLGWTQSELAQKAGLSVPTVKRMEGGGLAKSSLANVEAVKAALEAAGCTFLQDDGHGSGVRSTSSPA